MTLRRRRFTLLLGGAVASAGGAWFASRGRRPAEGPDDRTVRRSGVALGSTVSFTVVHEDRKLATAAIDAAFEALDQVEELMSLYRSTSSLCRLNRQGVLEHPHADLMAVVVASEELSRRTGGAFDITVQPLWELYSRTAKEQRRPSEAEIAAARATVDWRKIENTGHMLRLRGDGTAVTLNGIAQGFALDRVKRVFTQHGVAHALIDAGEIGGLGRRADDLPWRVGIKDPWADDPTGSALAVAELDGRCLATSGDYATSFSADRVDHHIFDPRTGRSPTELASVSVLAPTGMLADGLSTAVCVLGAEAGAELLESLPGCDGLFVRKDGSISTTSRFPRV